MTDLTTTLFTALAVALFSAIGLSGCALGDTAACMSDSTKEADCSVNDNDATENLFDADHRDRPSMRKVHPYIPHQTLSNYSLNATEIIEGEVRSSRTVFPEIGLPYTEVQLVVTDVLKGEVDDTVSVRLPGAASERRTVMVSGTPRVQTNDRVLWFLWTPGPNTHRSLLGLGQGAYTIRATGNGPDRIEGLHARDALTSLDAFKTSVQTYLEPSSTPKR